MLANLGPLVALGALTPLSVGVHSWRYADLAREMDNDTPGNVFPAAREAPIKFKSFEQNGETEASGPHLVAEEFVLIRRERPVMGKFVRVPVLLHGREAALRLALSEEPFESDF